MDPQITVQRVAEPFQLSAADLRRADELLSDPRMKALMREAERRVTRRVHADTLDGQRAFWQLISPPER